MGRSWMPMYWGDYLRDTQNLTTLQHGAYLLLIAHYWQNGALPPTHRERAQIARMSEKMWRANCAQIAEKFTPEWRHKRIDAELEKAERKVTLWQEAGKKGGLASSRNRSIKVGEALIDQQRLEALAERLSKRSSGRSSGIQASATNPLKRNSSVRGTNHIRKKERATLSVEQGVVDNCPPPSLASALCDGALATGALTEQAEPKQPVVKKPCDMTRAELDQLYAERRAREQAKAKQQPATGVAA